MAIQVLVPLLTDCDGYFTVGLLVVSDLFDDQAFARDDLQV